jgi:hypothetical protein
MHQVMRKLSSFLPFLKRRSRFGRVGQLAGRVGPKRGGLAMGGLLTLALPFIVRKIQSRRAARAQVPAY